MGPAAERATAGRDDGGVAAGQHCDLVARDATDIYGGEGFQRGGVDEGEVVIALIDDKERGAGPLCKRDGCCCRQGECAERECRNLECPPHDPEAYHRLNTIRIKRELNACGRYFRPRNRGRCVPGGKILQRAEDCGAKREVVGFG